MSSVGHIDLETKIFCIFKLILQVKMCKFLWCVEIYLRYFYSVYIWYSDPQLYLLLVEGSSVKVSQPYNSVCFEIAWRAQKCSVDYFECLRVSGQIEIDSGRKFFFLMSSENIPILFRIFGRLMFRFKPLVRVSNDTGFLLAPLVFFILNQSLNFKVSVEWFIWIILFCWM